MNLQFSTNQEPAKKRQRLRSGTNTLGLVYENEATDMGYEMGYNHEKRLGSPDT